MTSAVTASDVAAIRLLTSFIVCAAPGFALMKVARPITSKAGAHYVEFGAGPDTITASVPASAPVHTSADRAVQRGHTMLGQTALLRCAVWLPTVDKSTKRRMPDPSATASATLHGACGVGRLAMTVATRSATSAADLAASAPRATASVDDGGAGVEYDDAMSGRQLAGRRSESPYSPAR